MHPPVRACPLRRLSLTLRVNLLVWTVNSWDRQPYMTEVNNGSASLMPAYNQIERTFMVANYGANGGCVDNDDGEPLLPQPIRSRKPQQRSLASGLFHHNIF